MKKVILTKEVAEALEPKLNGIMWGNEEILDWHLGNKFIDSHVLNIEEGKVSTPDLLQAVFLGFEVEKTPTLDITGLEDMSEIRRKAVNDRLTHDIKSRESASMYSYADGVKDGIEHALDVLEIKLNN